jgi:RNA polymerase sigma factor (TIGR02999 family)
VHETFVKLARASELAAADRGHFYSLAARAMRQILLDDVRRRGAARRPPGDRLRVVEEVAAPVQAPLPELLAVDDALRRLERLDPQLGRLVELRVFGGLTLEEIAVIEARSVASLKRDWKKARAFLARELAGDPA